ncbi:MAG: hypothetical protein DMF69_05015, partial [Acidobacteria bacterium]
MKLKVLLTLATLGLAVFIAVGSTATQPASAAPGAQKVDLCHKTGNGYQPLSVAGNALASHLAHGDVQQPNGVVPGSPGFVFNAKCEAVGYSVNVAVDSSAQDPASPGNLFIGSGIPAGGFGTARNEAAGIELGMMILYRQGPTVISTDNYLDGVLDFNVASGPQSVANGSQSNVASRAAWNYTFSIATGLNGATTDLTDYTFKLLYDVDPGAGTSYRTFTLEQRDGGGPAQLSGFQWRDQGSGLVLIGDDEGNVNVTQNSQNYGFGFYQASLTSLYGPGSAFAGPAKFDFILQAFDGTQIIASNHIAVNVSAP